MYRVRRSLKHFLPSSVILIQINIQRIKHLLIRDHTPLTFMAENVQMEVRKMFYSTTHSTHFTYGYLASDMWYRTTQIAREETSCRHYMGYSFRLTAMDLLYAPSLRQDSTYHGFCYTSRGTLYFYHMSSFLRSFLPAYMQKTNT